MQSSALPYYPREDLWNVQVSSNPSRQMGCNPINSERALRQCSAVNQLDLWQVFVHGVRLNASKQTSLVELLKPSFDL